LLAVDEPAAIGLRRPVGDGVSERLAMLEQERFALAKDAQTLDEKLVERLALPAIDRPLRELAKIVGGVSMLMCAPRDTRRLRLSHLAASETSRTE
jgi:hypothetical protein